jgi:glycosyltransferase involved in cell wall biosynthesis
MKPSLSIVVPVLNEAGNIANAVQAFTSAVRANGIEQFEIIIVDNGSKDGTRKIIENMHAHDPHIKLVYPAKNEGSGQAVRDGVNMAVGEYAAYIPGDNEISLEAINNMFAAVGKADIINTYISNMHVRPFMRQVLSRNFTRFMRLLFRTPLKYFTGPGIIRTDLFRAARRTTFGFAFMAEIQVQLIKAGYSYVEVPMPLQPRTYGKGGVYRPRDMWRVFKALISMAYNIYFTNTVSAMKDLPRPAR